MITPTAYSNRLNEITIEWSSLNTQDSLTYEVYIKSPNTQRWERITETPDLAITVSNNSIVQSQDYVVKVRAANECGSGPFSEEVSVRTASVPSTISKVMVQRPLGSCIVHIVWTDPSQVQSIAVTGYSV
jgi:outer membrane lipoprotein-sorting protein